jgi:hypothetical protein
MQWSPDSHLRQTRYFRTCIFLGLLALPEGCVAQPKPSPWSAVTPETSEKAVVAHLWETILSTCPAKGSMSGTYSYFYSGLSNRDRTLYEYREPHPRIIADQLSTADKLNGVQWRGTALWTAAAYRSWTRPDGRWSEWKGMDGDDVDSKAILKSSAGRETPGGRLIFFLEKKRGQWSVSIASSGHVGINREPFDSNAFWSARMSCDSSAAANPLAAEDDRIKRETDRARTENQVRDSSLAAGQLKRQKTAPATADFEVDRDLGDALLCKGTVLYTRSPGLYPATGRKSEENILVKVVGANEDGGVLWNELRVRPVNDSRWPLPSPVGIPAGSYFVPMSAIQDSCPDYQPRNPGLFSNITLAHGLRAAGSLDRWVQKRAESAEPPRKKLGPMAVTATQFAGLLSETLKKRSPEFGVDPSQYGEAIKTVDGIVQLCSSIPATEFAAAMDQNGIPQLLRYREGKYKACVAPGVWRPEPESNQVPGFLISFDLSTHWQAGTKDWDGPKLRIEVYLNDTRKTIPISIQEYQRRYILLSADIKDRTQVAPALSTNSGDAVLTVVGKFAESLTVGHYWLLRDDPETALNNGGIRVPPRRTPLEVMRAACEKSEPACQKITLALDANREAKIYPDATGKGTFPGVSPGTYYLMISAIYKNRLLLWTEKVRLKAGSNSTVFSGTNSITIN